MKTRSRQALCALAVGTTLFLTSGLARAELVWDHKEVHLQATPLEKEVVAHYPFANEGKEPVKFKSLKSACGCVALTVSTMVVPPGAKGEVTVKFTPEFRIGDQKRPIVVEFDDAEHTRMALYLRVEIPEIIRPEPIFLKWAPEDQLSAKAVTIVTDEQYPVESVSVMPIDPPVTTEVSRIKNSSNFSVAVSPTRGAAPQSYYLNVEAKLKDGQTKRTRVYIVVR